MEPNRELIAALYREQVLRARAMTPEEKFLAGGELFDRVCRLMSDGIRAQFPGADEDRVRQILTERLALARRLEAAR
jgi:hypothetical protein